MTHIKGQENLETKFPCALTIRVPFPTARYASTALRVLQVDQELSPLVHRTFSLSRPLDNDGNGIAMDSKFAAGDKSVVDRTAEAVSEVNGSKSEDQGQQKVPSETDEEKIVLVTAYRATTNRMLRVSVNGFFESIGTVISCMRELDVDVAENEWIGDGLDDVDNLKAVQGLEEQGAL